MKARIALRVHPRARREALSGKLGDAYKIAVTAPPADGKANEAVLRYVADLLGAAKSNARIVIGASSQSKVIEVGGVSPESARRILDGLIEK